MNKRIISIMAVLLVVLGTILPGTRSEALTPRVILSEYSLSTDEIYPGDTFDVTFKLKNTSKNKVMNLKTTISSEGNSFIPSNGTGSSYVDEIKGEEETEISFSLSADKKLQEKTYKISIKTEYEDWNGSYDVTDTIYIPVKLKTEVLVSETYIAEEEIRLGDNIEIVSTINNIGGADIYKVTAEASGDNIADANCYVGKVAAGKSGNIDIITKTTNVTTTSTYDNKITITYEDIDGNKYTVTEFLGTGQGVIDVMEQDFSDIITVKEDTSRHLSNGDKLIIVVVAVIVMIIVLSAMRIMKRKRLEKNFD